MPRSLADHLQLWRNNTHPGPRYERFVVEMTGFKPSQFGQVTYDYAQQQYFIQIVIQANTVWVSSQIVCINQQVADENRRVISAETGIPEKNISGIIPPIQIAPTTSLEFLSLKIV